ncbi:hypothetical protein LTR12_008938 [Friedmanniomyces endolithicus]|nr:hypothetical protein LTR12_008938 [Friedmanniomyces endolithicus]
MARKTVSIVHSLFPPLEAVDTIPSVLAYIEQAKALLQMRRVDSHEVVPRTTGIIAMSQLAPRLVDHDASRLADRNDGVPDVLRFPGRQSYAGAEPIRVSVENLSALASDGDTVRRAAQGCVAEGAAVLPAAADGTAAGTLVACFGARGSIFVSGEAAVVWVHGGGGTRRMSFTGYQGCRARKEGLQAAYAAALCRGGGCGGETKVAQQDEDRC